MDEKQQPTGNAWAVFKVLLTVSVVIGSSFGAFTLVASMMMFHGDNTVPLICAMAAGISTAVVAAIIIRRFVR
jgi:amino acid transporter